MTDLNEQLRMELDGWWAALPLSPATVYLLRSVYRKGKLSADEVIHLSRLEDLPRAGEYLAHVIDLRAHLPRAEQIDGFVRDVRTITRKRRA